MERLWENGLSLWKVYGDPYKLASHSLPFFDLSHSANKAAATAHAPKKYSHYFHVNSETCQPAFTLV